MSHEKHPFATHRAISAFCTTLGCWGFCHFLQHPFAAECDPLIIVLHQRTDRFISHYDNTMDWMFLVVPLFQFGKRALGTCKGPQESGPVGQRSRLQACSCDQRPKDQRGAHDLPSGPLRLLPGSYNRRRMWAAKACAVPLPQGPQGAWGVCRAHLHLWGKANTALWLEFCGLEFCSHW